MKNIFLTGGSSYLGKNFIKKNEKWNIFALEHENKIAVQKNLKIIRNNSLTFKEIFNYHNIDTVIHFASNYSYKEAPTIQKLDYKLEENLINGSIESNVNKFIFAGSYFQDIYSEENSHYVVYKNNIEKRMIEVSSNSDVHFFSLHLGDIFGPNDLRNKLIPYLLKNENHPTVKINSDGKGAFSPIHVDDVLSHIINLEFTDKIFFETHNLYGKITSVKEFINFYKKVRNKDFECHFNMSKKSKQYYLKVDNKKIVFQDLEFQLLNL